MGRFAYAPPSTPPLRRQRRTSLLINMVNIGRAFGGRRRVDEIVRLLTDHKSGQLRPLVLVLAKRLDHVRERSRVVLLVAFRVAVSLDRKSTRLNSSHT